MNNDSIHLQEWLKIEHDRLDMFERFWMQNSKLDPCAFPMNMGAGDWDEQIQSVPNAVTHKEG